MKIKANHPCSVFTILYIIAFAISALQSALAVDIGPMTWAPRTEWINVKSPGAYTVATSTPNAVGDGVADDTVAIQGVLDWISYHSGTSAMGRHPTAYFPAGTYKISATLHITGNVGAGSPTNLIGCGSNTTIKWAGPAGAAMVWADGASDGTYEGIIWDGNNIAGCGFEEISSTGAYMTDIRHQNESFRNFTALGTYLPPDRFYASGYPGTAIISGINSAPVGEVTIFNCRFYNCTVGVYNPVDTFNYFVWEIEGCEFDNCGTGLNGGSGGVNLLVFDTHFQGSTGVDITQSGDFRGQRLTSSGSSQFFIGYMGGAALQDCWVDGWTHTGCAMELDGGGVATLSDLTFTHPPTGASPPIYNIGNGTPAELMVSHIVASNFPSNVGLQPGMAAFYSLAGAPRIQWVPPGALSGNVTSATQTFLNPSFPSEGTHIQDIMAYGADDFGVTNDITSDSTAAVQAAINAAATANNGTVVYIPAGLYNISTLNVTGSNYSIVGDGVLSKLYWNGSGSGNMINVTNPQNIAIRNINLVGAGGSENSLKETATGTSSLTLDNVIDYNTSSTGHGVVLSNLPAGAKVYIPVLNSPLTVQDCGQADIFALRAYIGGVNVSGATHPKTGYLGMMVGEGGIPAGRPPVASDPSIYNITVTDDQNLLMGPYYVEQCYNVLNLQAGSGTTPGHVSIQGSSEAPSPTSVSVNVNNYKGRLFYNQHIFFGGYTDPGEAESPVQITQTGTNHIDMVLANDYFDGPAPVFTMGTGANLVLALNESDAAGGPIADSPNPLTTSALKLIAQGLDDGRQLGAINLSAEYGLSKPTGLVGYWKLDEPAGPTVDTSMTGATGTWVNSPTFTTDYPAAIPYTDAGSMVFNGTTQEVDLGNPSALPTGTSARSLCGWAKANGTPGAYVFFASFGTNTWGNGMFLGASGTTLYAGAGQGDDLTFPSFWDGNWHFIALTFDGTTARLYADGVLKTSATKTDWNLISGHAYIGCQADHTQFWHGSVDDVRVYNRTLSAAEITALAGTPDPNGSLITGVTASSTSANVQGTPSLTVSNNSVVQGPSNILGASDSMGDSGFNQDSTDFGAFETNLSGANLTYNLGAKYKVTNLLVWNFSNPGSANAGAKSVTVQSSTDNVTYTTVGTYTFNQVTEAMTLGSSRPLPGNNPPYALGYPANVPVQVVPVSIPAAHYVKLVINNNWGAASYVGLNEVNFMGTPTP